LLAKNNLPPKKGTERVWDAGRQDWKNDSKEGKLKIEKRKWIGKSWADGEGKQLTKFLFLGRGGSGVTTKNKNSLKKRSSGEGRGRGAHL